MKHIRTLYPIALMVMTLVLSASCGKQKVNTPMGAAASDKEGGMKIAYVEVDTLMKQYQYCVDYNALLKKKTETIQNTLNSKGLALQKEAADFQSKLQQKAFTQEQAERIQTSLQKKQMQLQALQQSLSQEFDKQQQKYNEALRDSIQNFLKAYNKTQGFTYVLSKAGDNILLADSRYDITKDVVDGLNKRYKPSNEIKSRLHK